MPDYINVCLYTFAGLLALVLIVRRAHGFYVYRFTPRVPPAAPNTCRIACVGDSHTFGMLIEHRRANCYPAQLEKRLGKSFSVRNFGANGRAVQKAADLPYWDHPYFELSTQFAPDVVLIMLGSNDTRQPNWKGLEPYLRDYRALLTHYSSLASRPVIYALTPPAAFKLENQNALKFSMIDEAAREMTAGIKTLAGELGIEVIDIKAATAPHPEYFSFDGIHANAQGAMHIAETVYAAIRDRISKAGST